MHSRPRYTYLASWVGTWIDVVNVELEPHKAGRGPVRLPRVALPTISPGEAPASHFTGQVPLCA